MVAIDKLLDIIRLYHEAEPNLPITVVMEGPQRGDGRRVELTISYSATAEADTLTTKHYCSAANGELFPPREVSSPVVDVVSGIRQMVRALPPDDDGLRLAVTTRRVDAEAFQDDRGKPVVDSPMSGAQDDPPATQRTTISSR